MRSKRAILILILAGILAYGNTAKNGLFWDDDEFITKNAYVKSFGYIGQWFTKPLTYGAGVMSNYYRPLLLASFAVDYKLWGTWAAGYHLENLAWHVTAAILLYLFLSELLPQIFNFQFSIFNSAKMVAFATSLLWLVHPVHVEAVAYANSRGDSLATVFILLTLILWMKKKSGWSAVSFLTALLSKEFAIVTPGLILLIELLRTGQTGNKNYITDRRSSGRYIVSANLASKSASVKLYRLLTIVKRLYSLVIPRLLPHLIITAVYIFLRLTVLNFANTLNFYGVDLSRAERSEPMARYATSLPVRLMTFLKVLPVYAKILVWPNDLHMERTVEIATTIKDPVVLSSLAVILGLAGFFGWALIFSPRKSAGTSEPRIRALATHGRSPWEQVSVVWGAFGWFVISILPTSGIIPISQILAEHFLYLPSIGFFLIVSWLIVSLFSYRHSDPPTGGEESRRDCHGRQGDLAMTAYLIYWLILLGISIPLLIQTIRQNRIWRDPITFYEYTLSKTTPTARVYNNLGMAYADAGKHQLAINNYQLAISLGDVYPNPHYNLGNTLMELGRSEEAEKEYRRALEIDPTFHYATLKLGQMYLDRGKIDEAKNLVCPVYPTLPLCRN